MTLTSPEQFVRLSDRLSEFDSDTIHFLPSDDSKKVIANSKDIKTDIAKLRLSSKRVTERLHNGRNYCVYARPKGLAFIDIDVRKDGSGTLTLSDAQLAELIATLDTFTVMSRNGGYHFYLHNDTDISTNSHIHVNADTVGEYRTNWQYVVGAGSYIPKDQNATSNATGLYTIVIDKPIRQLSETIFPPWLKVGQQEEQDRTPQPKIGIGAISDRSSSDDEIIKRASAAKNGKKFQTLWSGNWQEIVPKFKSQSEADLSLCDELAFWTQDPVQIDRLFRRSGLYRKKWNREDYSVKVIDKAIAWVKKPSVSPTVTDNPAQPNVVVEPVLQTNPRMKKPNLPGNFVTSYIDFMGRRSDSYPEYQHASALTLLALIVNKHACIELNIGTIYPNLWIFILGQSTISRKTTACTMVETLTREFREWMILSNPGSPEAFIEDLEGVDRVDDILKNRGHGVMIRDEAAGFLHEMEKPYMSEMRDLLCQLYDNRPFSRKLRTSHRKSKTFFSLDDPYLNLFLATTPDNFERYTTYLDLSSGWMIRFLYYHPNYERPLRDISSISESDQEDYRKIKNWLQSLANLFDEKNIVFSLSGNGLSRYNEWIHTHQENMQKQHEEDRGLFDRLSIYAIKIAILLTIGDDKFLKNARAKRGVKITMTIDDACLDEAIREVNEYYLPMARIVITNIGRNEDRNTMDKVVGTLRRHDRKLTRSNLLRFTHLKKRDLDEAVDSLIEANEIAQTTDSGNIVYCLI